MKLITSPHCSPEQAMNTDRQLLKSLDEQSLLHFYSWQQPCITYGHFIDIEKYLLCLDVPRAKRPTGGGITFHSHDFSFSFFLPSSHPQYTLDPLKNYQKVNGVVAEAVQSAFDIKLELFSNQPSSVTPTFCSATPSLYDLFLRQKKIGGAAQRNKKQGFLHQGFLQLFPLSKTTLKAWIGEASPVYQEVQSCSGYLLEPSDEVTSTNILASAMADCFSVF